MLGYPSFRIFLVFLVDVFSRSGRVTLARGLPYPPCKRSAREESPTRDNFPLSCVTSNLDNLNGVIQFLS